MIGGQVENDEAVKASKDSRLDPIFVEAVSREIEDLQRGQVVEHPQVDGAQGVV